jgi:hypothetical protein
MIFNVFKNHSISSAGKLYEPVWRDRISDNLVLYLVAGLGVLQGVALVLWGSKGAVIMLGAAYIYVLFRWPHIALIIAVVIIFDGLGFINAETFFRIPGVFKLRDLVFLSLFLPLLINRKWLERGQNVFQNSSGLLFPIAVMLFLTTLQMIRTSLQYDLPLSTCIMAGRHYWYYAFVPLAAIYLDTLQKRKVIYRLFLAVILVLASVVILQTIMLIQGGKLFLADDIQIQPSQWGTLNLFRIYPPGEPVLVLGFALAFWGLFLRKSTREMLGYAAMASLCALALLFINSRMRWVHSLLVVLIPMFVLGPHIRKARGRLLYGLPILVLVLISLFMLAFRSNVFVSGIGERAVSAWTDFRDKKGTWEGRLEDNQFRFKLIREHPLFGLGFVHDDYAWRFGGAGEIVLDEGLSYKQGVTSTDSGIVDLLVHFGAIGAIWAMWYFISVLRFCSKIMRSAKIGVLHWTSIPLIGYMTGGVLTFVTLGLFTMAGDIIGHSFVLGMLATGAHIQLRSEY